MLACLQAMEDVTSRATVDDSMDDCSTNATFTMNVCSETCYESDVYHGWSPATEEGLDEEMAATVNTVIPNYRTASIEDFASYTAKTDYRNIPSYKKSESAATVTEFASVSSSEGTAEELSSNLGVGGILGVSGLVATVVLSVGFLTVKNLQSELARGETTV